MPCGDWLVQSRCQSRRTPAQEAQSRLSASKGAESVHRCSSRDTCFRGKILCERPSSRKRKSGITRTQITATFSRAIRPDAYRPARKWARSAHRAQPRPLSRPPARRHCAARSPGRRHRAPDSRFIMSLMSPRPEFGIVEANATLYGRRSIATYDKTLALSYCDPSRAPIRP